MMHDDPSKRRGIWPWLLAAVVVAGGVCVLGVALLLRRPSVVIPPVPSPNAYALLLKAADRVERADLLGAMLERPNQFADASDAELAELFDANAAVIDEVAQLAAMPGRAPIPQNETAFGELMDAVGQMRQLSRLLLAAAEHWQRRGDVEQAARADATNLALAGQCQRGLLLTYMVGMAIESQAAAGLQCRAPDLEPEVALEIFDQVVALENARATVGEAVDGDYAWWVQTATLPMRFAIAASGGHASHVAAARKAAEEANVRARTETLVAAARLALRAATPAEAEPPAEDAAWAIVQKRLPAPLLEEADVREQVKLRLGAGLLTEPPAEP